MNKPHTEAVCLLVMTAKPGMEKKLKEALEALIAPTCQEPGCVSYELFQDVNNPRQLVMFERFRSQKDLSDHVAQPYIKQFIANEFSSCVESHQDIDLSSVAGKKCTES